MEQAIADERRAFARATSARQPRAGDLEVAGGWAVYTGDGLFSNRAFAVGLTEPLLNRDLDRIEAFYADRDSRAQIELASIAEPATARILSDRGYRLSRFRNIFAYDLEIGSPGAPDGITVDVVDDGNRALWSETLVRGFGYDRDDDVRRVEEWNDALLATPGLTALIARLDGTPVASASVLAQGSVAVFGGAATLPVHRRRGAQSALIAARLQLARAAGCELAVVTADPGGTSARNSERAGFHLVCTHAVMTAPR